MSSLPGLSGLPRGARESLAGDEATRVARESAAEHRARADEFRRSAEEARRMRENLDA
jgi:hypothetical protein